ncbi:MAG: flavodoxin [Bacteroidales bacterium]
MKSIGIFYGSSLGTTADIASKIADKIKVDSSNVFDISSVEAGKVNDFECILLGSSTWGLGELQDDWTTFIEQLKKQSLSGKLVGLFGTGDSEAYSDTFCDALGIIYDELENTGCKFIGQYEPKGYSATDSKVNIYGKFVGLAVDEMNESNKTDERIDMWLAEVSQAL